MAARLGNVVYWIFFMAAALVGDFIYHAAPRPLREPDVIVIVSAVAMLYVIGWGFRYVLSGRTAL